MSSRDTHEDIRSRFVGRRFYKTDIEEGLTVVDYDGLFAIIQFDDGTFWDDAIDPHTFSGEQSEMLRVSDAGLDSEEYIPLTGGGPTVENACSLKEHKFSPLPSDIGLDTPSRWYPNADAYLKACRCVKCGLSGDVIASYLGGVTPSVCHRCETDIIPGENEGAWSPNPDWADCKVCDECLAIIEEEYEEYDVKCCSCGEPAGTNETATRIHKRSEITEKLGVDTSDAEGDHFFSCEVCFTAAVMGTEPIAPFDAALICKNVEHAQRATETVELETNDPHVTELSFDPQAETVTLCSRVPRTVSGEDDWYVNEYPLSPEAVLGKTGVVAELDYLFKVMKSASFRLPSYAHNHEIECTVIATEDDFREVGLELDVSQYNPIREPMELH